MHETFLEAHSGAAVLVFGTLIAGAVAEWLVTFRERLQTEGGPRARLAVRTLVEATTTRPAGRHESDRGTKRILVLGMVAGLVAAWLVARYVRSGSARQRLGLGDPRRSHLCSPASLSASGRSSCWAASSAETSRSRRR